MRSVVVAILVAAAARTAAADPPTAATRALMTQLGDGTVPAASLIDPATGAWILEGDRATHVCGTTALLELAVEVRVHAATWGADAGCANHADDAGCDLPERVDAVPFDGYTLRFDRSARGLVLRALVRGEASAKATIDRGAQCTGAAPLPAEPPNANGHPVVTVAMVRALARGAAKLDPLIDRERGLTIVSEQPAADDDSHDRDERICNRAAIRRELASLRAQMTSILALDPSDVELSCANDASTSTCLLHVIGEWGDNLSLHFRQTDRGLVLDAWTNFDENGVPLHETERHTVRTARALTRAWVTPCPQTP